MSKLNDPSSGPPHLQYRRSEPQRFLACQRPRQRRPDWLQPVSTCNDTRSNACMRRMARAAPAISCSTENQQALKRLAASRTQTDGGRSPYGAGVSGRPEGAGRGPPLPTRPNTVIKWRQRFVVRGLKGLRDTPRPGAQRVYHETFRNRVSATLKQPPPPPVKPPWTGRRWPWWCGARSMRCGYRYIGLLLWSKEWLVNRKRVRQLCRL